MQKGLLVHIYKSSLGDCSNGGVSARCQSAILVGPDIPEIHSASDERPALTLLPLRNMNGFCADRKKPDGAGLKAVPVHHEHGHKRPMSGGCFIYTSDDRFPSNCPIPLFDRFED
ncbi:MAG: hypothetical protein RJS97_05100 [Parvibaculaceae bacterium]|tara:strand:- start:528 stop:872 length:345 start_codon:yes stop_codon:yes gene_type:complete